MKMLGKLTVAEGGENPIQLRKAGNSAKFFETLMVLKNGVGTVSRSAEDCFSYQKPSHIRIGGNPQGVEGVCTKTGELVSLLEVLTFTDGTARAVLRTRAMQVVWMQLIKSNNYCTSFQKLEAVVENCLMVLHFDIAILRALKGAWTAFTQSIKMVGSGNLTAPNGLKYSVQVTARIPYLAVVEFAINAKVMELRVMQSPEAGWCTVHLLDSSILGSVWLDVTPDVDSMVDQINADCCREMWPYFRQCKCAIESLYLKTY